jgi:hypothetical protein
MAMLYHPSAADLLLHFLPNKPPIVTLIQLPIRYPSGVFHVSQSCTSPSHFTSLFPTTSSTLCNDTCTCCCLWFVISSKELILLVSILQPTTSIEASTCAVWIAIFGWLTKTFSALANHNSKIHSPRSFVSARNNTKDQSTVACRTGQFNQ